MQGVAVAQVPNPWVRPGQLVFAAIALIAGAVSLWLPTVALLGAPLLVMAMRYFELARFRLVHRSGWLLVYSLWVTISVGMNAPWQENPRLELGFLTLFALLGSVLFVQQRQHHELMLRADKQSPTQYGVDWAMGGMLALVVIQLLAAMLEALDPTSPLWMSVFGVLAVPLLWLQVMRSPRFPTWMGSWLLLLSLAALVDWLIAPKGEAVTLWPNGVACTLLWLYLRVSKRVRLTFAAPAVAA